MKIIAVNGSPRRDRGLTYRVLAALSESVERYGVESEIVHLIDQEPRYCVHCGHDCFEDSNCLQEEQATARSRVLDGADAVIVGAPVYVWQPSGLTCAFFDKVRRTGGTWRKMDANEKTQPALGLAVAGGTGTGVFSALKSIYAWFCLWKYRPVEPLPVTRFNLDQVIENAPYTGKTLVGMERTPFRDAAQLISAYDGLKYLSFSRIDEFRWLALRMAEGMERKNVSPEIAGRIRRLLEQAENEKNGSESGAGKILEAYGMGLDNWK